MSPDDGVGTEYPLELDDEIPTATRGASMDDTCDTDFVPDSLAEFLADTESQLEAALDFGNASPVKSLQLQPSASTELEDIGKEGLKSALDGVATTTNTTASNLSNPVKPVGTTSAVKSTQSTTTEGIKSEKVKPATSTKKKKISESSKKRKQRAPTAAADLFSPCSDVAGPFDTDMGSACRPNPASQFMTHSAAKYEALGYEEPIPDVESNGGVRNEPGERGHSVSKVESGKSEVLSDLKEEVVVEEKEVVVQEPHVSRRLDFDVAGPGNGGVPPETAEPQYVKISEEKKQPVAEQTAGSNEDPNESQLMPNVSFAPDVDDVPAITLMSPSALSMGSTTPDPKPLSPPE